MNRVVFFIIGIAVLGFTALEFGARVEKDGGQVYIVHQPSERWDVPQAETFEKFG